MDARVRSAGLAALLVGCASGGAGSNSEPATVPVYARADQVPCRFEVIQRITAQARFTSNPQALGRERERVLEREAARIGADAVLLPQVTQNTVVAVQVGPGGAPTGPTEVPVEGDAIRFIAGTCTDGR